jgi:hypothetical protein
MNVTKNTVLALLVTGLSCVQLCAMKPVVEPLAPGVDGTELAEWSGKLSPAFDKLEKRVVRLEEQAGLAIVKQQGPSPFTPGFFDRCKGLGRYFEFPFKGGTLVADVTARWNALNQAGCTKQVKGEKLAVIIAVAGAADGAQAVACSYVLDRACGMTWSARGRAIKERLLFPKIAIGLKTVPVTVWRKLMAPLPEEDGQ